MQEGILDFFGQFQNSRKDRITAGRHLKLVPAIGSQYDSSYTVSQSPSDWLRGSRIEENVLFFGNGNEEETNHGGQDAGRRSLLLQVQLVLLLEQQLLLLLLAVRMRAELVARVDEAELIGTAEADHAAYPCERVVSDNKIIRISGKMVVER